MSARLRQIVLVSLIVAFGLTGCAGQYKFSDDEYRALGDPQTINRGN
ncbi:type VI secretion protein [Pseudomonas sp. DSP3-2-2]